jgi:hypothetical protein
MTRRGWMAGAAAIVAAIALVAWSFATARRQTQDAGEQGETTTLVRPLLSRNSAGEAVITISLKQQAAIGLETEPLVPAVQPLEETAYGVVLDPAPLIDLNGQLDSASAALAASRAEYQRAKLLHARSQNVSLKDLQSAEARFRTDDAALAALKQRLADNWGESIPAMAPEARHRLVAGLVRRSGAIARVTLPASRALGALPPSALVSILGYDSQPLLAQSVTYAPSIDPQLQGLAFLLRLESHGFPLRPGAAVTARLRLAGQVQSGVVVPGSALVRAEGTTWAYVQTAPTHFARRRLAAARTDSRESFVTQGFAPGERVVVTGAQALLSAEFGAEIQLED